MIDNPTILRYQTDDATWLRGLRDGDDRPGTYPFDVQGQVPGTPHNEALYPNAWLRERKPHMLRDCKP